MKYGAFSRIDGGWVGGMGLGGGMKIKFREGDGGEFEYGLGTGCRRCRS